MSHEHIKLNRDFKYDEDESEIVVKFQYSAGFPGGYNDPPEPDEINILKIECNDKDITDLISEEEFQDIEDYLYESWEDTSADEQADLAFEAYREAMDRE